MQDSLILDQITSDSTIQQTEYTILVVDDHLEIRELFEYIFKMHIYNIITASDGFNAIKEFVKHEPDLVIMDQMMPGIDGTETVKKMKHLNPTTKFIMMSADTTTIKLSKKDRRNIPVLSKPFAYNDVVDLIQATLFRVNEEDIKHKMVSVLLDDDVYEKIRLSQSQKIKNEQTSYSFSKTVNDHLRLIL